MTSFLEVESIFVFGGASCEEEPGTVLGTIHCYSATTATWDTNLPSMKTARFGAASVVIDRQVLIFGGASHMPMLSNGFLTACEGFDTRTKSWHDLPPMSIARVGHCAAEWMGRVFIFGGTTHSIPRVEYASSGECYNPTLQRWSPIAPMSTTRDSAVAVSIPGMGILVIGGLGGRDGGPLQSIELYDPNTNSWTIVPWQLPARLFFFTAFCIEKTLIIVGGRSVQRRGASADCWSIDLLLDTPFWSPLPPLPAPLTEMASVLA